MTGALTSETLVEITREIWTALLADEGHLLPGGVGGGEISAAVSLTGACNGTACLTCSRGAARRAASLMFELPDEELTGDEIDDAMGELINVVGGNIKGVLPGPTSLSLPSVQEGPFHAPGHLDLGYKVLFTWLDEPVAVTVWTDAG